MADEETNEETVASSPEGSDAIGPTLTRKEQRTATKHAIASKRPARTPEERHEERQAERARKAKARTARRAKEREARKAEPKQEPPAAVEHVHGRKKVRIGIVTSDKADKTITVQIASARRHRRYAKVVRRTSKLHAHDEINEAHEGDTVRVEESRPLSRSKRWKLIEIVERAR